MAANITIARRDLANGAVEFIGNRKVVYITATGSATADNDTGTYSVTDMKNPQHAIVPGCSASFSGTTLTLTSECALGNNVFHGMILSTPGDL